MAKQVCLHEFMGNHFSKLMALETICGYLPQCLALRRVTPNNPLFEYDVLNTAAHWGASETADGMRVDTCKSGISSTSSTSADSSSGSGYDCGERLHVKHPFFVLSLQNGSCSSTFHFIYILTWRRLGALHFLSSSGYRVNVRFPSPAVRAKRS